MHSTVPCGKSDADGLSRQCCDGPAGYGLAECPALPGTGPKRRLHLGRSHCFLTSHSVPAAEGPSLSGAAVGAVQTVLRTLLLESLCQT